MELMGAWDPGVIAVADPGPEAAARPGLVPLPRGLRRQGRPGAIMGGVDGYSLLGEGPEGVRRLPELPRDHGRSRRPTTRPSTRRPVNKEAQTVVTEPYLKARPARPTTRRRTSRSGSTRVYGQNVGNALNVAVVDLLAGQGHAAADHRRRQRGRGEGLGRSTMSTPARHRGRTIAADRSRAARRGRRRTPPPPAPPRRRRRGIGWRSGFEIALLAGPAIIVFVGFVIFPVVWPRTTASSAGRATARPPTSSVCRTTSRSSRTPTSSKRSAQRLHRRRVAGHPGAGGARCWRCCSTARCAAGR